MQIDPKQNALLAALPEEVLEHWLPFLEPVDLSLGPVLCASGAATDYVYFPVSGIVSLVYGVEHGHEVAVIRSDGRGAWRENVFVERMWRSAKYERIYLKAYDGVAATRANIADYFN